MTHPAAKPLAALLCSALLAACASTPRQHAEQPDDGAPRAEETVAPAPRPLVPVAFYRGDSASPLTLAEVASRAADADVVVFGELHGQPAALSAQRRLLAAIAAMRPGSAALGLEFYERDAQVHLDDYLSGLTDEEAFRRATRKDAAKDDHRDLIEIARDAGLPVWALNAPRRYVRLARTVGFHAYDAMTDEQRRLVAAPDALTEGRYADEFYSMMGAMGGHGETDDGPSEMAISFFRSQNVWDATMADTAVRALDEGARPLVIIVGRFHTDFEGGLVERLRTRAPGADILTLSALESANPSDDDRGRADVLVGAGE